MQLTTRHLVLAGLFVATLIVLLLFIKGFLLGGQEKSAEAACRHSIQLHSTLVRLSGEKAAPAIQCTPRHVTARGENAVKTFAHELAFCWERWQAGDVELFNKSGTYCNPCSIITYKEGKPITTTALYHYLEQEQHGSVTLRDYLFPQMSDEYALSTEQAKVPELFKGKLEPGEEYAVVFWYDKNHLLKEWQEAVKKGRVVETGESAVHGAVKGAATGALVGAGGVVIFFAACTFLTGGACAAGTAIAALASKLVIVGGTLIGGAIGATSEKVPLPEWLSAVIIVKHQGEEYSELGCTDTSQQGAPKSVEGAENI